MNLLQKQLSGFFNRKQKFSNGKVILPFGSDPWDFKIHVSLCIFRSIQNHVMDSLIKLMCVQKPKVTVSNAAGDALVDRARSREASDFLHNTDADIFLQFDDDIQITSEDAIRLCKKANDIKGVVSAVCVVRREEGTWIACKPLDEKPIIIADDSELTEIRWAGAGCLAIHRNVFLDTIQHFKMPLLHPTDLKFYGFYQPMIWQNEKGEHLYLSEDWSASERFRQAGYKIYLDPSVRTTHFGLYGFTPDDLLRQPRKHYDRIKYEDVPNGNLIISKDDGVRGNLAFK